MGKGDNDSGGGGEESDVVYKESAEPMLVLPSDSYSNDKILVSDRKYSSCPAYTNTNYCLKENVNNFVLRRTFYSKQGFKNTCYSSA